MDPQIRQFKSNARDAIDSRNLQNALAKLSSGFPARRLQAAARLPEFEALRDEARLIKDHVLEHLDIYLERYETEVMAAGGQVHWCADADAARAKIEEICKAAGAKTVTKSKSMIGEEIAINRHLEAKDIKPVETDLGEYIIQLRNEPPSHIIAPAVHLTMDQVADTFIAHHEDLEPTRKLDEPRKLLEEARAQLRNKFIGADVGLTGANMLIAETGSNVLVTNEGNADLT
jgi:L-lactate dehydrogenase complex protein LldF